MNDKESTHPLVRRIHNINITRGNSGTKLLVDGNKGAGKLLLVSKSKRWKVRTITLVRDLTNLMEGSNGLSNDTTSFGVANGCLDFDQARK